jgi:hypothetical protein
MSAQLPLSWSSSVDTPSEPSPLLEELDRLALHAAGRKRRNAVIFARRVGLSGDAPQTLQTVGDIFDMTRERVRQIESKCWQRISVSRMRTPGLDQAIRIIESLAPAPTEQIVQQLIAHQLVDRPIQPHAIVALANRLRGMNWTVAEYGTATFLIGADQQDLLPHISAIAKRAVTHWGMATIDDIAASAGEKCAFVVSSEFVRVVLSNRPDFRWLDEGMGWFWITSTARNRLANQIYKILAVWNRIAISELREGVGRAHRMQGFAPPATALIEFCRQLPDVAVNGRSVIATHSREMSHLLSENQLTIARIMLDRGPVVRRDDLEEWCTSAGMNVSSFYIYISYLPFIVRYAPGVYGIRGAPVDPGVVESLSKTRSLPTKVQIDYGWTDDARIWVAYRLSKNALATGVLGIPAGLKEYIEGDFDLMTTDGTRMGTFRCKDGTAWGLSPFFRRRGGDEEDYIALEFDLTKRAATIRIGTDELLDIYQPV